MLLNTGDHDAAQLTQV